MTMLLSTGEVPDASRVSLVPYLSTRGSIPDFTVTMAMAMTN